MKVGRYNIQFEKGYCNGRRFNCLDGELFSNPQLLVAALKKRQLKNRDVDLFFAAPSSPKADGTISWEIDQHSTTTFQFYSLDDRSEHKDDLIARSSNLISQIKSLSKSGPTSDAYEKKIDEAIDQVVKNEHVLELFAGYNPDAKIYFPVVVGWGGSYVDDVENDHALKAQSDLVLEDVSNKLTEKTPVEGTEDGKPLQSQHITGKLNKPGFLYQLLWLILFLLVLTITYFILPACGVRGLIVTCKGEALNLAILEKQRDNLIDELYLENNICTSTFTKPKAPEEIPEPDPLGDLSVPDPSQVVEERLEKSGGTKADLMVSLIWNTNEDLDLHVSCPNEKTVSHVSRDSLINQCGTLDVDANVASDIQKLTNQPIENILLIPQSGSFKIMVRSVVNPKSRPEGTPFEVHVSDLDKSMVFEGIIKPSENKLFRFDRQ
jgi:hypothetical protein